MNKFLEILTVNIAAGGQNRFELSGDYFEIIDSQYPITVLLEDRNGAQIGRMGAAEMSYFLRDTPYQAITVSSTQAQTVRIAFGSGEAGTRRTAGIVQVVDGGRARTESGQAFIGAVNLGAVASQNAHVQIFNPPASGKNTVLKKIAISSSSAGLIVIGRYNTALTTGGAVAAGANKMATGGAGVTQLRNQSSAGNLVVSSPMHLPQIQAAQTSIFNLEEPIILTPGTGLVIEHNSVNTDLASTFEFYESTI